jgi:hypothetical protein
MTNSELDLAIPGNGQGGEEYADAEDFIQSAALDTLDAPAGLSHWFPSEYVVLCLGPRGSGKSTRVARHLLIALAQGYPVFTNYELYPEKIGITNKPKPLDMEFLLSFDTSMNHAVIGIGEVDTWIERKRAMATSNIMVEKFLNQLRKRGLRVFLDTQAPSLPSIILSKVDLMIWSHDFYYTDWGRDNEIPKGTTFYYEEEDASGLFTGVPGTRWRTALRNATRLWPLYNTYQIFDPWQWARKTKIVGEEMVFDMDTGKICSEGEYGQVEEQRQLEVYDTFIKAQYRAWGNDLIKVARLNKALLHDEDGHYVISLDGLQKAIVRQKPGTKARRHIEKLFASLQELEHTSKGYLAQIDRGRNVIRMSKPLTEADGS